MKNPPKITLDDIARQAGVSTAAVSQALSGKGNLSPATRERILQVVEELSYQPDKVAQSLALRRASQVYGKRLPASKNKRLPPPGVMVFYNLPELEEVLLLEIQQREEEGYEVSQFRQNLAQWNKPTKQKLYRLYSELLSAPRRPDFHYVEPESLTAIRAARPAGPRQEALSLSANVLYDRIFGAWLGRTAGCVCGKPLQAGLSKKQIMAYLQQAGNYPLGGYVPRLVPLPPDFTLNPHSEGAFRGEIRGAPQDDDTDYTLLSLHILESYGLDFKTAQVATEWLEHIPYFATFTTERTVYRNLVWNIHPDQAADYANPEREFIGGRTRADLYGYITPGKPELAAALAYKDAALSHTKNGVYAAMLTAAMISWAYVTSDPLELVQVGLSEIPAGCRLAQAVQEALDAHQRGEDWELAYEQMLLKYGSYSPIHAINNTLWMILALLYSQGSFERALGIALTCGMDTSSNAASVGSILGLLYGASRLPAHWIDPLEDTLYTGIARYSEVRLSELARRTARLAEMVLSNHSLNAKEDK